MRRSGAPSVRASSSTSLAKRPRTNKTGTRKPTVVSIGKQVLPKQLFNRLKYVESAVVTLTTGGFQKYLFSCNGMYDPNYTGTGHQPMYFGKINELYDHYTVLSSAIRVTYTSGVSPSTTQVLRCALYIDDDIDPNLNNVSAMCERPGGKMSIIGPGQAQTTLTMGWNAKKTFGGDPQSQSELQGNGTANPSEQSFYVIGVDDLALNSQNVVLNVEIWYNVVWDELTSIAQA